MYRHFFPRRRRYEYLYRSAVSVRSRVRSAVSGRSCVSPPSRWCRSWRRSSACSCCATGSSTRWRTAPCTRRNTRTNSSSPRSPSPAPSASSASCRRSSAVGWRRSPRTNCRRSARAPSTCRYSTPPTSLSYRKTTQRRSESRRYDETEKRAGFLCCSYCL